MSSIFIYTNMKTKINVYLKEVSEYGSAPYYTPASQETDNTQNTVQNSVTEVLDKKSSITGILDTIFTDAKKFEEICNLAAKRHEENLVGLTGSVRIEEIERFTKLLMTLMSKLPNDVPGRLNLAAESARAHLEYLIARLKLSTATRMASLHNSITPTIA